MPIQQQAGASAAAPTGITWQDSGFPPYGHISRDYRLESDRQPVPPRFRVQGRPATSDEWQRFVDREVAILADWLWPRFDRATQSWVGNATSHMKTLTQVDLQLMKELSQQLQQEASFPVHGPNGGTPARKGLKHSHMDLFYAEDRTARPTLNVYLPDLDATLLADLDKAVGDWLQGYGDAHIFFKLKFQRPRAYQMTYLLGNATDDYVYRFATSAVTPSMISGHSFSGLVVRCGALLDKQLSVERNLNALRGMKQYMVDIGDRRVFAGVHYPSDNLASWWCALRLCDHYYGTAGQDAKDLIWAAISDHSAVYDAIKTEAKKAGSPFAKPLAKLQAEAQRTADPNAIP